MSHHPAQPRGARRGLTLLEILLVLGLLVLLTALAWPATERPFAAWRLRQAADVIRIAWTQARNEAIAGEQVVRFQYALGGNCYQVGSLEAVADVMAEMPIDAETSPIPAETGTALPEGVTFHSAESDAEEPSAASSAILFYPDGTTSTARLVLANQYGRLVDVAVRGLTGVVTVGEVYSSEEEVP